MGVMLYSLKRKMNKSKCANCEREIDLDIDAQTSCHGCEKDFCFALFSTCYDEYHRKNNLRSGHRALSISDPTWVINLVVSKDK